MDSHRAKVVGADISSLDAELVAERKLKTDIANLKTRVFSALWVQVGGIICLVGGLQSALAVESNRRDS